jgi:hypothetical protein
VTVSDLDGFYDTTEDHEFIIDQEPTLWERFFGRRSR